MPRYLNPSKICILVLVSLYCDDYVPNNASIPILSFIVSNVRQADSTKRNLRGVSTISLNIEDFEVVLAHHHSKITGRTLFESFLNRLWSIDCLHALHQFFTDLSGYLAGQQRKANSEAEKQPTARFMLSPVSPIGIFVRKSQLEFTRLQFDDSVKLWTTLVQFRRPVEKSWLRIHPSAPSDIPDVNILSIDVNFRGDLSETVYGSTADEKAEDQFLSADEIESILEFQLERLQKYGNRAPEDMRTRMREMFGQAYPTPNLLHFVLFFDAWRAGDYTQAFENLHRYFDYTMQVRDKTHYQYALLHMAILQADFGFYGEAFAAMNETITTARENQDMSCLNFSMSWLDHFSKAYPKELERAGYAGMLGREHEGLAFLKTKAHEMKMWNLASSTILSEAKAFLSSGGDVRIALEHVYQSSHLNLVHNLQSNVGTQLLMQSSIYGRLGLSELADAYCETLLDAYRDKSPVEEVVRATCRRAFNATHAGNDVEAVEYLSSLEPDVERTLKFKQYVSSCSRISELRRNINQNDNISAHNLLVSLRSATSAEPELRSQIVLLEIEWQRHMGNFESAFSLISTATESMKLESADVYQQMHLLLLKARLFAEAGIPEKGFSIAVRVASASAKARIMPALWEAVRVLSNILIALGERDPAKRLLDAVLPQAMPEVAGTI